VQNLSTDKYLRVLQTH